MTIDVKAYGEFEGLVKTDGRHTELECAKYLSFATSLLAPSVPVSVEIGREDRSYFGSTDFVLAVRLINDHNKEEDYAFIWELKAPQCYLFEYDDNQNRCRPTEEFAKAENQLLHYYLQAEGDHQFRQRFGIMNSKNIRMGGVIIGRSADRMLKSVRAPADVKKADIALKVREQYLYASAGIRILTWDRVLSFVQPTTPAPPASR